MIWARIGALFMFLGILLGAFGAHFLKSRLETLGYMDAYKTAVLYQLVHGLGLFIVAWLLSFSTNDRLRLAGLFFVLGILLFSGSLYLLSITGTRLFGAITPLGGLCFMAGWLLVFWSIA